MTELDPEAAAFLETIPEPPGPEHPDENIAFRKEICELIEASEPFARACWYKCSQDVVFWFNTFVWTQNPKDYPDDPHRPVILFPKQKEYVLCLHEHVEQGRELLLEKSREQLASVATSAYALWRLFYCNNASCLVGSKKKDLVEGVSYAKAIFPKIDYIINYLPDRMLPDGWNRKKPGPCRKDMSFTNPVSNLSIEGDTCNEDFARSGRFAWVWLDEFESIDRQEEIHAAVSNTTNCYVYTTTPKGLKMFARMVQSGNHKVFSLHWTANHLWHPKGYKPEECQWNRKDTSKSIWPKEWVCSVGCKVHPNGGWPHSERYDNECKKLSYDQVKIAQELDINYSKSGGAVFDQDKITAAMTFLAEKKPEFRYYALNFDTRKAETIQIGFDSNTDDWYKIAKGLPVVASDAKGGPLRVWKEPFSCRDKECVCRGTGMHTYILGGDVCRNVDQDSHCAYIFDITAGEAVAEWYGQCEATDLGVEWAKLCKWYGSSSVAGMPDTYAAVENNDQGNTVNNTLLRMGIQVPIERKENDRKNSKGRKLGVVMDRWNKSFIIHECLSPEIHAGDPSNPVLPRLVVPFMGFWREAQTYVYKYSDKTTTRPEYPKMEAQTRKDHDDRVMSLACALYVAKKYFRMVRGYVSNRPEVQNQIWKRSA